MGEFTAIYYMIAGALGAVLGLGVGIFVLESNLLPEWMATALGLGLLLAVYALGMGVSAWLIVYFTGISQWWALLPGAFLGIFFVYAAIQMAQN